MGEDPRGEGTWGPRQCSTHSGGQHGNSVLAGLIRRGKGVKADRAQEGSTYGGGLYMDPGHVQITMVPTEAPALVCDS